jgi:hypothetical protein
MRFVSMSPGEHYGYRKTKRLGGALQHIEVIAKSKPGLWKVKFYDRSRASRIS